MDPHQVATSVLAAVRAARTEAPTALVSLAFDEPVREAFELYFPVRYTNSSKSLGEAHLGGGWVEVSFREFLGGAHSDEYILCAGAVSVRHVIPPVELTPDAQEVYTRLRLDGVQPVAAKEAAGLLA